MEGTEDITDKKHQAFFSTLHLLEGSFSGKVVALGVIIETLQILGFVVNPAIPWGSLVSDSLKWSPYTFQFPLWDAAVFGYAYYSHMVLL